MFSCDREMRSVQAGGRYNSMQGFAFSTPRNVFLYGRGGQENISCTFRFVGGPDQKVEIKVSNISVRGRDCRTVFDPTTEIYRCEHG